MKNTYYAFILLGVLTLIGCPVAQGSSSGSCSSDNSQTATQDESGIEGLVEDYNFDNVNEENVYTVSGAVKTDGKTGSAYQFDGYDDYLLVEDNDSLTLAVQGSIEVLIKINNHRYCGGIVHKGEKKDFSDEAYTLQFWTPDGTVAFGLNNTSGQLLLLKSTNTINTDEWYHIVVTWDAENVKLYINGQLNNETPNTIGEVRDSDGGLVIGAQITEMLNNTYGMVGMDGIIDNVNLYNRALTGTEIEENYNQFFSE